MPVLDRTSRYVPLLRRLFRPETILLLGGATGLLVLLGGMDLFSRHVMGGAARLDEWLLLAGRDPVNPELIRGPHWVDEMVRDLTGLGGPAVLGLMTASVTAWLVLRRQHASAVLVVVATLGGLMVSLLLKDFFMRPRPEIVPSLMVETSPSFPSGHSMISAVVYLTLGSLLARVEEDRLVRMLFLVLAVLITGAVGISRVLLGVHFPTDVLVGWVMGLTWASICWYGVLLLQERGTVEPPPEDLRLEPVLDELERTA
ncbi:MAG: phosphatase PAP2 family protein [Gemmatimonadales bacterium]|nr:MAG: phosphatase PAP2 family protein [Gemmatimonadales bacterium]